MREREGTCRLPAGFAFSPPKAGNELAAWSGQRTLNCLRQAAHGPSAVRMQIAGPKLVCRPIVIYWRRLVAQITLERRRDLCALVCLAKAASKIQPNTHFSMAPLLPSSTRANLPPLCRALHQSFPAAFSRWPELERSRLRERGKSAKKKIEGKLFVSVGMVQGARVWRKSARASEFASRSGLSAKRASERASKRVGAIVHERKQTPKSEQGIACTLSDVAN